MGIIAVSGPVSTRDAALVKSVVAGIVPEIRAYIEELNGAREEEIKALTARCKALEDAASKPVEIDLVPVEKLIEAEIAKLPTPEPAKEVDQGHLAAMVNEAVSALPPPKDGKSVEIEDVLPAIVAEVEKAIAAFPLPKDGNDGQDGKDAAGIVEALKDNGELVLTLQDGRLIRTGIRDGEKGQDGRDGFGLDDFDMERGADGRTYILKFQRGEVSHEYEWTLPTPAYCGVFKHGEEYAPGDFVTWGGSLWHCNERTTDKPDVGPWTLACKKGRDGRDAK
jgi:hypothetical protein